jgi:NADH-quinone oxidoreductase subunit D
MVMDIGALTPFLWAIREREKILDLYDLICGARFTTSYTRIGGVAQDITDQALKGTRKFIDEFSGYLQECRDLVERNKIFINRTEGIGYMSKEDVINYGITGPVLRAAGVESDVRRDNPYLVYDQLDFRIPSYTDSDCLARYYVRVEEMVESTKIVKQCLDKIPQAHTMHTQLKKFFRRKKEFTQRWKSLFMTL